MIRRLYICLFWLALIGGAASAQDTAPDPSAPEITSDIAAAQAEDAVPQSSQDPEWTALAERVIGAIDSGRVSTPVLDGLRAELAEWRDIFLAQEAENSGRISTLSSQLEALGAVPEGGEPEEIAALRASLATEIAIHQTPATLASEAHAEANGLISEIDAIVRERQTEQLLDRSASPLNPTEWGGALEDLDVAWRSTTSEVAEGARAPASRLADIPVVLVLSVIAFVLLLRGRRWMGRLEALVRGQSLRGRGVWAFAVSFGKVVLPFAGLLAFTAALQATGLMGRRLTAIVQAVPYAGLYPIVAHWIAGQLMPRTEAEDPGPLGLALAASAKAHRLFVLLGYVMGLLIMVIAILAANGIDGTSEDVLTFPFALAAAVVLFRFGRVLLRSRQEVATDAEPLPLRARLLGLVGQLAMALAILGALASALGYSASTERLIIPAVGTLFLLGILVLMQRLVFDLYALVTGQEDNSDGLIPVTIAFLLVFGAVPVLSLLWGARVTDLTELWAQFQEGFSLGETRISPTDFLTFVVIFVVGYTLVRLLQGALKSTILPKTRMDVGGQNAVSAGVGYVGIFAAAVVAITTAGIDLSGLAIVAGALSVGIGFGLQNIVSNFVSGIILLIERPISEGDWIEVGGQMGYVRDISVRSTRIETFDRTDVIVPNADLVSGTVTNYTRGNSVGRLIVPVGVAYGTDTRRVSEVLQEIAEAHPMVLLNPPPSIVFQGFGADSLDFEIRAILRDVNWMLSVKTEINHQINARFIEEGFEIPFAQRDIWLRNAEALTGATAADDEGTT